MPKAIMAPDIMMIMPLFFALAHSDCHLWKRLVSIMPLLWHSPVTDSRWDGARHSSIAQASNHTTDNEKCVRRGGTASKGNLKHCPDDHEDNSPERRGSPAPGVTPHQYRDGAEDASDLVDCHTSCLDILVTEALIRFEAVFACRIKRRHQRNVLLEVVERDQS